MPKSFIQLNRTFFPVSAGQSSEEAIEASSWLGENCTISWNDMLQNKRSVVIASAGAGKTEEIKQKTIELRGQGEQAFFLRLELLKDDFELAFEGGSLGKYDDFQRWLTTKERGFFFLDSVDEAKLKDPRDFERALRRIDHKLGLKRDDATILVTSRLTWEPTTDLDLVRRYLPFELHASQDDNQSVTPEENIPKVELILEKVTGEDVVKTDAEETQLPVFSLTALNEGQIRVFATSRGIEDVNAFMDEVERADAKKYAKAPKDLDDLIDFWQEYSTMGSPLELTQHSVKSKIREHNIDRARLQDLDDTRALDAVKRIAAAMMLTGTQRIAIPDTEKRNDVIDIQDILPEWNIEDCKVLLERALFDEAVYGTVRFHHRSTKEYLAAEWFLDRLENGSRRNVAQLFFRNQYGINIVTPSLRPILSWIAIRDDEFCTRALKVAPEIIVSGGDPSKLPREIREKALLNICQKLEINKSNRDSFDINVIQRFAQKDLEGCVLELLVRYIHNDEVQHLLLRMVWQGKYQRCINHALSIASDTELKDYTRVNALRAIAAAGADTQKNEIINQLVDTSENLNRRIMSAILDDFVPEILSITDFIYSLRKLDEIDEHEFDQLKYRFESFTDEINIEQLEELVTTLDPLLFNLQSDEQPDFQISNKYKWLVKSTEKSLARLIEYTSPYILHENVLNLFHRLARYRTYTASSERIDIRGKIATNKVLNGALFWYEVERHRETSDKSISVYWEIPAWKCFHSTDVFTLDEAITWVEEKKFIDDKCIAISIAFAIYRETGRNRTLRERLKRVAKPYEEVAAKLHLLLNPPPVSDEHKKYKRQDAAWKRQDAKRNEKQEANRQWWKDHIRSHIDEIADTSAAHESKFYRSQRILFDQMRNASERNGKWSHTNWRSLKEAYGEDVAITFRDFLIECVYIYNPELPSEIGELTNTTTEATIFGLSGLEIQAAETQDWAKTLNSNQVMHVVRYALHELNGFSSWLKQLHDAHPDIVETLLLREMEWELLENQQEHPSHYVISKVLYSADFLYQKLGPPLLEILQQHNPIHGKHLTQILQIIFSSSNVDDQKIAEVARGKLSEQLSPFEQAIWFAAWVSVAPNQAISPLGTHLKSSVVPADATQFAMHFVTALVSNDREDYSINARETYKKPAHLCDLYLLILEFVKVDEDIDRTNEGMYSPELRDNAQDARNALFNTLSTIPGKDAFLALQRITLEHPHGTDRKWMTAHLKTRAQQDADLSSWFAEDVIEFENGSESQPRNRRQLYQVTLNRLLDMKDWLEQGEDSAASTWILQTEETKLRIVIAAWLRERKRGLYTVHQEEEQADSKRPDIRFHNSNCDAPVPIELKIVDNGWSGPNLFERLENQLCNDYLRDFRTSFGIFLLTSRGEKKTWQHPESGENLNFQILIEALQKRADEIVVGRADIDEITVVGIDLTKRNTPSR